MSVTRHPGPFVVVGMGRSGSSSLAGLLHAAGVHMGAELKAADEQNPAGYFEDLEVLRLHERWLDKAELSLGSVSDRFPLPATPEASEAVTALVARREARGRPWGVKAPGILFFWPAWRAQLPAGTVLLLPFRHPAAVARSLVATGVSRERAHALWLQLNRLALEAIDGGPFPGVVLDFDEPQTFVRYVASVLGSNVDTHRPRLHHHVAGAEPLEPELHRVYAELRRRAGSGSCTAAHGADFDWYATAQELAERAESLYEAVRSVEAERERLREELRAAAEEREALAARLRDRERQLDAFASSTSWRITRPLRGARRLVGRR